MEPQDILTMLRARGVEVAAVDGKLRYRPVEAVSPELRDALREQKAALLHRLARAVQGGQPLGTEEAWCAAHPGAIALAEYDPLHPEDGHAPPASPRQDRMC